ncbi:MAG TPA: alpha/beta hydrolase [Hyphomonadaceae bacterium]|nr:alpha/beta hydrolase [Hyphomonadaceae bacterium]
MKALLLASALLAGCVFAPMALAQNPAGDWHTELTFTPAPTSHIGVRIKEASPGVYSGTIGTMEGGVWDTPLEVTLKDGELSFRNTVSGSNFKGKWDAAQSGWTGTYTTAAGTTPATLTKGMPAPAPTIAGFDGRWEGALDVQGLKLRLVFRTTTDEHGSRTLMDSPDQAATGFPASNLKRAGDVVSLEVPSIQGTYSGTLSADGATVTGNWSQVGQSFPLILTRVSTDPNLPPPKRPQTPKPPFAYNSEDVSIPNPKAPGVTLACTLTTPKTKAPHPAAVLITGSGAEDRDETIFGHHIFGVLADHLTNKGIAVLRCDDRGFAKSTGKFVNATPVDFATDTEAQVAFLKTRKDIDAKKIGLIGHSEGSITGPMVAARDPSIAFVVLMGGLGAKGVDVMTEQRALISKASGASDALIDVQRAVTRTIFQAAVDAPDDATAKQKVSDLLLAAGGTAGMTKEMADAQADQYASPYIRWLLSYDPVPVLAQVKAPVLAVTGSKDVQVPAAQNLPLLKKELTASKDVTTTEIPSLNHLFQTAKTGGPGEYNEIEETFAPVALDTISDWIVKRMKP